MSSLRKSFTLAEKIKFLDEYEKKSPSMSLRKFCEANHLDESTMRSFIKKKDQLLSGPSHRQRKRKREGQYAELEAAMTLWIEEKNSQGALLTVSDVRCPPL